MSKEQPDEAEVFEFSVAKRHPVLRILMVSLGALFALLSFIPFTSEGISLIPVIQLLVGVLVCVRGVTLGRQRVRADEESIVIRAEFGSVRQILWQDVAAIRSRGRTSNGPMAIYLTNGQEMRLPMMAADARPLVAMSERLAGGR